MWLWRAWISRPSRTSRSSPCQVLKDRDKRMNVVNQLLTIKELFEFYPRGPRKLMKPNTISINYLWVAKGGSLWVYGVSRAWGRKSPNTPWNEETTFGRRRTNASLWFIYLQSFRHFAFKFLFLDQEIATKWPYNWSPGLISGAFCIIFRAWPVGVGPGAKFGRKVTEKPKLKL